MSGKKHEQVMRIVHVSQGLDIGGLEKLLVEFARLVDRATFDLHFVSLTTRGPLADAIAAHGWPVTALEEPGGLRPGLVLRLARLFRRLGPDVVHTHDDRPLIYGAPAARLAGVAGLVHTKHYGMLAQLTPRRAVLVRMASRLCQRFVCISHDSARHSIRRGVSSDRVCTMWNGIDLDRFAYTGPAPSGPAVTVARLSPEKDIATLLRATALVVREEPAFRLQIAGDGPEQARLQALVAELRLEKHVLFLGAVRDIPALLSRSRLFILPSLSEGISLTLLEALASGLPVLATRVGGNPEVVDSNSGVLVPAGNPREMAQALVRLWRDPALQQELGRAGRHRVEQHFDIRHMVGRYEELYRDVHVGPGREGRSSRPMEKIACTL